MLMEYWAVLELYGTMTSLDVWSTFSTCMIYIGHRKKAGSCKLKLFLSNISKGSRWWRLEKFAQVRLETFSLDMFFK